MLLAFLLVVFTASQTTEGDSSSGSQSIRIDQFMGSKPPPEWPQQGSNDAPYVYSVLYSVAINNLTIFPKSEPVIPSGSFLPIHNVIRPGQKLKVKANNSFVVFFQTQTTSHYYNLQNPVNQSYKVEVANVIESKRVGQRLHTVQLPLNMSCDFIGHKQPYLKMRARMNIDFQHSRTQHIYIVPFLMVCTNPQNIQNFNNYHQYAYIFFLVMLNLCLQIYHAYPRDQGHFVVFIIYLSSSMIFDNRIVSYFICISLFLTVVLKEWRDRRISSKVLSLYLFLTFLIFVLIFFEVGVLSKAVDWNFLTIALDNFVIIQISMVMVLRLIKLHRLRQVFWYFIVVAIFSSLYQGNPNKFFAINFQNVYNLSCLRRDLFFPLMMLPISNYFASMTWWTQRIIAIAIATVSILPLGWGVKIMAGVFVAVLCFQIKKNSLDAIKHTY